MRPGPPRGGTHYAGMVEGACRAAGFEPRIRHRVTDLGTLLDLARAGLAVAIVPRWQVSAGHGSLALRPVAGGGLGPGCSRPARRGAAERRRSRAAAALRERLSGT